MCRIVTARIHVRDTGSKGNTRGIRTASFVAMNAEGETMTSWLLHLDDHPLVLVDSWECDVQHALFHAVREVRRDE